MNKEFKLDTSEKTYKTYKEKSEWLVMAPFWLLLFQYQYSSDCPAAWKVAPKL